MFGYCAAADSGLDIVWLCSTDGVSAGSADWGEGFSGGVVVSFCSIEYCDVSVSESDSTCDCGSVVSGLETSGCCSSTSVVLWAEDGWSLLGWIVWLAGSLQ